MLSEKNKKREIKMQINIDEANKLAYFKPNPYKEGEIYPPFLVIDWENKTITVKLRDLEHEKLPERTHRNLVSSFPLPLQIDATKLKLWIEQKISTLIQDIIHETTISGGGLEASLIRGQELLNLLECKIQQIDEDMSHYGEIWDIYNWLEGYPLDKNEDPEGFIVDLLKEAKEEDIILTGDIRECVSKMLNLANLDLLPHASELAFKPLKTYKIEGHVSIEKRVTAGSKTSGRIYLPKDWIGGMVEVVLTKSPVLYMDKK